MTARVEFAAIRLLSGLTRFMSVAVTRRAGAALGLLAYVVDRRHRAIALENLAAAFPGRTDAERTAIARRVFAHFGSVLLELLKAGTMTAAELERHVEVEGEDRVRAAQAEGRGFLIFTGHFGYWEILALSHATRLGPFSVLARRLDNPLLNTMLEQIRGRGGNSVIHRQGAVRRILRELGANQGVGLLIDQHLHSDAVLVQFFQRPAATTTALAALALRTGAPVIPVFALPLPGGRYKLVYEHPVEPPAADSPDAIREFTQRCTDVLEMYVRRHPDLWLWMHRRWRERDVSVGAFEQDAREADADA